MKKKLYLANPYGFSKQTKNLLPDFINIFQEILHSGLKGPLLLSHVTKSHKELIVLSWLTSYSFYKLGFSLNAVWGSDLQTTVSKPIRFEGIGLHKGLWSKLVVLPAKIDSGICFKRLDSNKSNKFVPAVLDNVVMSELCTRLANSDGVSVSTIEHLMAALTGCGINNALLEICLLYTSDAADE